MRKERSENTTQVPVSTELGNTAIALGDEGVRGVDSRELVDRRPQVDRTASQPVKACAVVASIMQFEQFEYRRFIAAGEGPARLRMRGVVPIGTTCSFTDTTQLPDGRSLCLSPHQHLAARLRR
jgi:hypothetical protein